MLLNPIGYAMIPSTMVWRQEDSSIASCFPRLNVQPTLHWTNSAHLKHQPAEHFIVQWCSMLVCNLLRCIVVVGQVQHNGTRLENSHIPILERWDSAIGIDLQKPIFFLGILGDVDGHHFVMQT